MRGLLLYNPHATTTNARVRDAVTNVLADRFELHVQPTKARGHATEIAAHAVAEGVEVVFSLGGDGTANETIQALAGTDVAFAHVPGGGTNILARALGLPNHPVRAAHQICQAADQQPRTINLGKADDRWFACIAGIGFDAAIVQRVEDRPRLKRWGRQMAFVWSGLAEWFGDESGVTDEVTVETVDGRRHGPYAITIVGNTDPYTFLGPRPLRLTPQATFDTALDLVAIESVGTRTILASLRRAFASGSHIASEHVTYWHDQQLYTLRSHEPLALMVDGDYVGHRTEVVIRSFPNALRVYS